MRTKRNVRKNIRRDIDFSQNENKVIDILLQLRTAGTTAHIAREANLPRSSAIYILEKLEKRRMAERLIRKTKTGKRHMWQPKREQSGASLEKISVDITDEYEPGEGPQMLTKYKTPR